MTNIPDLTSLFPNLRIIEVQKISYCGVACLADSIRYLLHKDITQDEIGSALEIDPDKGTPHHKMIEGAKMYGLQYKEIEDSSLTLTELARELDKPNTRIILNIMLERDPGEGGNFEDEKEGGHYVVFEGLAKIKDQVFVIYNDPSFPASICLVPIETAEKKWYDYVPELNYQKVSHWALVLSKPE